MASSFYSTRPGTSPLEILVNYYIKSKGHFTPSKKQLQRAKSLLHDKYDPHCCDDPTDVLQLATKQSGPFLTLFETMLNGMPLKGNLYSFKRLNNALDIAINCC